MEASEASPEVGTLTPRKEDIESIHDINTDPSEINNEPAPSESRVKHTWRFWVVFFSLCLISFISAIDATIVVTALPVITRSIGGESKYVWIANCFPLAATATQPFYGQISNIFGRRNPMLVSIALFALGSGIGGGATSVAMLIAGRTVQGLGSGGLFVLLDLITCDMVPLRERGKYLGIMLSTAAIGTTVGMIIPAPHNQACSGILRFITCLVSSNCSSIGNY